MCSSVKNISDNKKARKSQLTKPELLLPAGSREKLDYAINYGADAVYLGTVDFSLRSMRKGDLITFDNLKETVALAHSYNKKAYLTLNIFAFSDDIEKLMPYLDLIKDAKPDAIIISDFGIFRLLKKHLPEIDIHISTQTNILNYETVKFWRDLGAKRCILARELSIAQIAQIKNKVSDIELEVFVHGSQCMSFSGRCLLSDYLTNNERKANQGNCAQPCRWKYKLVEETRPYESYEIYENERGAHILSPKDLALINYLPQLIDAGVNSFKIEGRTKSLYYVSAVAKTYRRAIDSLFEENNYQGNVGLSDELLKIGNRGYTTGFFLEPQNTDGYSYDISKGLAGADFLCEFINQVTANDMVQRQVSQPLYKVKIKNKINLNDELEIITPDESILSTVEAIFNLEFEKKEVANTNDEVLLQLSNPPKNHKYALGRSLLKVASGEALRKTTWRSNPQKMTMSLDFQEQETGG